MIPALILFCSITIGPQECTEQVSLDEISREVLPMECAVGGMNSQMELAADPRGGKGVFVKLVCGRRPEGEGVHGDQ
jgi:hypothetical protein